MNNIGGRVNGDSVFSLYELEVGEHICFTADNKCRIIYRGEIISKNNVNEETLCDILVYRVRIKEENKEPNLLELNKKVLINNVPLDVLFIKDREISLGFIDIDNQLKDIFPPE